MRKWTYRATIRASYVGYVTQAVVNNLVPLLLLIFQDAFALQLSQVTLLVTFNFLLQLFIDAFSAPVVDRIGYRPCIIAAHVLVAAGLLGMGIFPFLFPHAFFGLLAALLLYAIGGGLIEVLISPIVEACPTDNKTSAMGLLHSFYCWGAVAVIALSTVFLSVCGKNSWPVLTALWAIVPVCNAFVFSRVPIAALTEAGEGMTVHELAKNRKFWGFVILMLCAGAAELSMSQWASAFAESGLGISKAAGDLLGPCLFAVLMGTARVLYAKCAARVSYRKALAFCACLCAASYLLAGLSRMPVLALLGCGLCGFSVGMMWPGTFSAVSRAFPKGGTAMFALCALAGDIGCTAGPTLVGFVSDAAGGALQAGLLCAIVFPVLMLICAGFQRE